MIFFFQWNIVSDSPFAPTYIVLTTSGAFSEISFVTSNLEPPNGISQQIQLINEPPVQEDFLINQIGSSQFT